MTDPDDLVPPFKVRAMQIVAFALVLGLAAFAVIAVYIVQIQGNGRGMAPAAGAPILSLLAVVMLAVMSVASFVFPAYVLRRDLRQIARGEWQPRQGAASDYPSDAAKLLAVYLTTMIVGLALVQGAGFFCCIAYLLEGQAYMLAPIALALLLQVARFPTAGRVRPWLERQLDWLEQERGRAGSV